MSGTDIGTGVSGSSSRGARRRFLQTVATVAGVGLAGCSGGDEPPADCEPLDPAPNYGDWFAGVSNYDGTCDRRGEDTVSVAVGAKGNDAFWAFDPAAVAVSAGTTVRWNWTGQGGPHNVVETRDVFDSGEAVESTDTTFSYGFERPGVFRYVCTPHVSQGMKGAVFVAIE